MEIASVLLRGICICSFADTALNETIDALLRNDDSFNELAILCIISNLSGYAKSPGDGL